MLNNEGKTQYFEFLPFAPERSLVSKILNNNNIHALVIQTDLSFHLSFHVSRDLHLDLWPMPQRGGKVVCILKNMFTHECIFTLLDYTEVGF